MELGTPEAVFSVLRREAPLPAGLLPPPTAADICPGMTDCAFVVRRLPGWESLEERLDSGRLTAKEVRGLGEDLARVIGSLHRLGDGLGEVPAAAVIWDPFRRRWWVASLGDPDPDPVRTDLARLGRLLRRAGPLDWGMSWAVGAAVTGRLDGVGTFLELWRRRGGWTTGVLVGGVSLFLLGLALRI